MYWHTGHSPPQTQGDDARCEMPASSQGPVLSSPGTSFLWHWPRSRPTTVILRSPSGQLSLLTPLTLPVYLTSLHYTTRPTPREDCQKRNTREAERSTTAPPPASTLYPLEIQHSRAVHCLLDIRAAGDFFHFHCSQVFGVWVGILPRCSRLLRLARSRRE